VLDTSEETARRTTESDAAYVGWPRGRYKKRREGSYGHPREKGYQRRDKFPRTLYEVGLSFKPTSAAHRDLPTPGTSQGSGCSPVPVLSTMP